MQLTVLGQSLDGLNVFPLHLPYRRDAGARRHTSNKYGAGAALSLTAAELRPREVEILAEHVQQRPPSSAVVERFCPFTFSENSRGMKTSSRLVP